MRVIVLGAGALGSLVGGLLSRTHDVTLVGRSPHVEAIRAAGLRLTGIEDDTLHPRATTTTVNLDPADLLILTVKAHATGTALAQAGDAIGPDTLVLTLQNGLGNAEGVAGRVGLGRTVVGVTSHGALLEAPGVVAHTGEGDTTIGPFAGPDLPAHHELAGYLTDAGLETTVVEDMRPVLWNKVAVNAAINPLTAITGLPNGALLEVPELAALLEAVAQEVETIARATGVPVEEGSYVAQARLVAERTAKNRSSMLQDIERGRATEIDAICGAIVAAGAEAGVDAARNRALHALVKGIEATLRYDG